MRSSTLNKVRDTSMFFHCFRKISPNNGRCFMRIVLAGIFLIVFCGQAHGTTLVKKDFQELVDEAEGIIEGTIGQIESNYDSNFLIYTFVTLEDLIIHSGSYEEDTLVLQFTGGQIGDEIQTIEGSPRLTSGDRVILFLRANGQAHVPVVGWTQGVFRVITDNTSQEQTVRDHAGNRIFGILGNSIVKEEREKSEVFFVDPETGSFSRDSDGRDAEFQSSNNEAAPLNATMSKKGFIEAILQKGSRQATTVGTLKSIEMEKSRLAAPSLRKPDRSASQSLMEEGVPPTRYSNPLNMKEK